MEELKDCKGISICLKEWEELTRLKYENYHKTVSETVRLLLNHYYQFNNCPPNIAPITYNEAMRRIAELSKLEKTEGNLILLELSPVSKLSNPLQQDSNTAQDNTPQDPPILDNSDEDASFNHFAKTYPS